MQITRWFNVSAFVAVFLFGGISVAIKFALRDFDPLGLVLLRLLVSSILLFLVLVMAERDWGVQRQDLPLLCLAGIAGAGMFQVLFTVGLKYTTAANASFIMAISPIFTTLVAAAIGQERLRTLTLWGVLLSFGGVFLLVGGKGLGFHMESLSGDLIVLASAFSWGLYAIAASPLLRRYTALKITTYGTILAAGAVLPFTLGALLHQGWSSITLEGGAGASYFIIFGGVVAYWLWGRGVGQLGPSQAAVYLYFQPVVGALAAILLLAERLDPLQWGGFGAILLGVGLARKW